MTQLRPTDLKRLHRMWRRRKTGRLALILEGLQGPYNVGSIVRTAAGFALDELFVVEGTISPTNPKAQKTAMGTERYLDIHYAATVSEAVAAAKAADYAVLGLELTDDAQPIHEADLTRDVCLVLGNENRGITAATLNSCDGVVYIPQLGNVGSFNVAVAASIACYEVRRQSWQGWQGSDQTPDDGDMPDDEE
ncbi:MAG: TrmH family RNA methyltransferase [Acidothermaceae bacterium]